MEKNEVMIADFRAAWPELFKARAFKGGKPRFTISALLDPKQHAPELAKIESIIDEIVRAEFGGDRPDESFLCLRTGADPKKRKNPDGSWKTGFGPGVKILSASSSEKFPPRVIDTKAKGKVPLASDDPRIFSGCRMNGIFVIKYAKDYGRICAFMQVLQYHRSDTRIAGGGDDSALDDIPDPVEPAMAGELDDL